MTEGWGSLFRAVNRWLLECQTIKSAVLFGSSARSHSELAPADHWSDIDLHVVSNQPNELEDIDWPRAVPDCSFCFQVARAATGGTRKVTAVFSAGQIDMVIVSSMALRLGVTALKYGLNRKFRFIDVALNEMATCLHTGYRFLKGKERWGHIYARVAGLSGIRLSDDQLTSMADVALCELMWVIQKLDRGELVTAQHAIHLKLIDTNLRLWREFRLRRRLPVPSFGLGRRLEQLESPIDKKSVSISATLTPDGLQNAATQCYNGLKTIMRELVPAWHVPPMIEDVVASRFRWPLKPGR